MVNEKTKIRFFKFLLLLGVLTLITLILNFRFDLLTSIQTTLLMWSFIILCTPGSHGKIALGVPVKIVTKKHLLYPEIYMWPTAIALNIFTYFVTPWVYFNTIITHLLFQIICYPFPGWFIILTSALGTFYNCLIGYKRIQTSKLHKFIRIILIFLGFFILLSFTHKDIVILLNVRA